MATLTALVGSVVLGTGVAEAAPSITVDPAGPLAAKAKVTVTAQGFTPLTNVVVAECKPDGTGVVTGPTACADASTGSSAVAVADAQGAVTATITITVGDIRSGVSCTADECVVAAISTVSSTIQALAPITLTGAGTSLPAASATPSSSASASSAPTPSASPSATTSATPTPEPSTTEPAATPEPSSPPAGNAGSPPKALPRTGPEDASRSLIIGLVVLQVGLVVAARTQRARPAPGRHSG